MTAGRFGGGQDAAPGDAMERAAVEFERLRLMPAPLRAAALRAVGENDGALAEELAQLLSFHETRMLPLDPDAPVELQVREGAERREFGGFELIRELGEGGMGIVHLAQQRHPRRLVALKMLRAGLASASARHRFERETRLLALLEHPGIARLYEAGELQTPLGAQPYFAMEYVEGVTVTQFAREMNLGVREKVQLLVEICKAVQHAHDRGVVHRDLKPANVLVDGKGVPRVLDFGVAVIQSDDERLTTVRSSGAQLIGTLPYMSPEQLAGDRAIGPAADVYALGVMLFELFCGQLPHDLTRRSFADAVAHLRTEEPRRLGSVDRFFRGDLETIVGRALEREALRRYPTAGALAADLERWLDHRPIEARRAGTVYQLRKFAQRHLVLTVALLILLLVLISATVISTSLAVRAAASEVLAEEEAYRASIQAAAAEIRLLDHGAAAARLEGVDPGRRHQWEYRVLHSMADTSAMTRRSGAASAPALLVPPEQDRVVVVDHGGGVVAWSVPDLAEIGAGEIPGSTVTCGSIHARTGFLGTREGRVVALDIDTLTSRTLWEGDRSIRHARVSHDGSRIAICTEASDVMLIRTADGSVQPPPSSQSAIGAALAAAFSPDDRHMACAGSTGHVRITDFQSGTSRLFGGALPSLSIRPTALAFSEDGEGLWLAGPGGIVLVAWRTEEVRGMKRVAVPPSHVFADALVTYGPLVVAPTSMETLALWNLEREEAVATFAGHERRVRAAAVLDRHHLLLSVADDFTLRAWALDGATRPSPQPRGGRVAMALSPRGEAVASVSTGGLLQLIDPETGTHRRDLPRLPQTMTSVAWCGELIAAGLSVEDHGGIAWFDPDSVEAPVVTPWPQRVIRLAPATERAVIVVSLSGAVSLAGRDGPEPAPWGDALGSVRVIALSPDRKDVCGVSAEGVVSFVAASSPHDSRRVTLDDGPSSVAWSTDGRHVAVGCQAGAIALIDARTTEMKILEGHTLAAAAIAFHPDQPRLISGGADRTIRVWDTRAGRELLVLRGHDLPVHALCFSRDGHTLLSGALDGSLRTWSARSAPREIMKHRSE